MFETRKALIMVFLDSHAFQNSSEQKLRVQSPHSPREASPDLGLRRTRIQITLPRDLEQFGNLPEASCPPL